MFNFNHLYYFYVTAKYGGISKASRVLRISQPSLSSQLRVLGKSMDRNLFQKSGRRSVLTNEAQEIYGYCRKIFEASEQLEDFLKMDSGSRGAHMRIGVSDQMERPFAADLLSEFMKTSDFAKSSRISMVSGNHAELMQQLQARQVDVVLTDRKAYGEKISVLCEAGLPVVSVASKRLLREKNLIGKNIKQIVSFLPGGLVLPSARLKLRHEIDDFFQKEKINASMAFESDLLAAVVRAIVDGVGMGFVPLAYVSEEVRSGRLILLGQKSGYWKHRLLLVSRKGNEGNKMARSIRDTLMAMTSP